MALVLATNFICRRLINLRVNTFILRTHAEPFQRFHLSGVLLFSMFLCSAAAVVISSLINERITRRLLLSLSLMSSSLYTYIQNMSSDPTGSVYACRRDERAAAIYSKRLIQCTFNDVQGNATLPPPPAPLITATLAPLVRPYSLLALYNQHQNILLVHFFYSDPNNPTYYITRAITHSPAANYVVCFFTSMAHGGVGGVL